MTGFCRGGVYVNSSSQLVPAVRNALNSTWRITLMIKAGNVLPVQTTTARGMNVTLYSYDAV